MASSEAQIVSLKPSDSERIDAVCALLVSAFRDLSPAWVPTVDAARPVVLGALGPRMLNRALILDGRVAGWIGARHAYGSVWEIHPLAVDETVRGRGCGRALVEDIERIVKRLGALTLLLGTSDELGRTNLTGKDLFADPAGALRDLASSDRGHPLGFWQSLGYVPVGLIPNAEGAGKPTILLAKPIHGERRAFQT